MKKLNFVISLTTQENDYQREQAASAEEAARRLGVNAQILYADNDSSKQSQQLIQVIQSSADARPDGIIFEPVGGPALPQVARAAVAAGIPWVILNRDVAYVNELRRAHSVPIFAVTSDHEEIGRIQGRQLAALLPRGGSVLYITGPAENLAAEQRTAGMSETKPAEVQIKLMRGQWTEASAHRAVSSWLRLSTSQQSRIDAVACQSDAMALGARKAFAELADDVSRARWLSLPYTGVDGVPRTGIALVKQGLLAATVIVPPNTGRAIDLLVKVRHGAPMPPSRTLTVPASFPEIDEINLSPADKCSTTVTGEASQSAAATP